MELFLALAGVAAVLAFKLRPFRRRRRRRAKIFPIALPVQAAPRERLRHDPIISTDRAIEITGQCWVIDGDTIDIKGKRIRLAGIDAPELDDPYGQVAKFALMRLCKGQVIHAVADGEVSYDRYVATCYLPDGRDLSAEMVKAGHAIDWRKFSGGKYRHHEPEGIRKKLWRCDARQKGKMPQTLPD